MYSNTPVLAFDYGGVKNQLENLSDLFKVKPHDYQGLLTKIEVLLNLNEDQKKEALQDAQLVSLHGRPLSNLNRYLQPNRNLLILTDQNSLPKAIAQFKMQNPNVNFEISSNHYAEIRKNISDTLLDVAIAQDQNEDEEIGIINLAKGKFVILEPKNNQDKKYKSI